MAVDSSAAQFSPLSKRDQSRQRASFARVLRRRYQIGHQPVYVAAFFHVRQVTGAVEQVNGDIGGQSLGVCGGDDPVGAPPDHLPRHGCRRQRAAQVDLLAAARESGGSDRHHVDITEKPNAS